MAVVTAPAAAGREDLSLVMLHIINQDTPRLGQETDGLFLGNIFPAILRITDIFGEAAVEQALVAPVPPAILVVPETLVLRHLH